MLDEQRKIIARRIIAEKNKPVTIQMNEKKRDYIS